MLLFVVVACRALNKTLCLHNVLPVKNDVTFLGKNNKTTKSRVDPFFLSFLQLLEGRIIPSVAFVMMCPGRMSPDMRFLVGQADHSGGQN